MAESVGNAYLNVVPKLEGDAASIGSDFGTEMSGGMLGTIGAGAVAVGNVISEAVMGAASTIGEQFSKTLWNYADYEQLVGGVDTLFKDASATVQENAKRAFSTAGMSANEYMENVTSFSASLIQSLDGDTVKAAAVADKAMVDMSDNANKMGTDMERITDAYQGFAKQNYTMLDNLKFGYGGTKTEMERLLADAGKIAGVEFNIDSYADVIEAIHVIQESMDITGTTMEEGSTTISGSINQLQGAWDNFLTAVGDGGATMDLTEVTEGLFASLGAVAENIVPRIGTIIQTTIETFPGIISDGLAGLSGVISENIGSMFGEDMQAQFDGFVEQFSEIFTNIQGIIEQALPIIQEVLMPVLETVGSVIGTVASVIIEVVGGVVEFVNTNVMPLVAQIAEEITPVIEQIAADIQERLPAIQEVIESVMSTIGSVIETVWPVISTTIMTVVDTVSNAIQVAWPVIQTVFETVFGAIQGVVQTVWPVIESIITTAVDVISGAIQGISGIVDGVVSTFNSIKDAITDPIESARDLIGSAIDAIKGFFNFDIQWPHIPLPHFSVSGSPNPLDWLEGGLPSISIDWYAKGGFVDGATLIGAGERGAEFIWPSYEPYMSQYADALASKMNGNGEIVINLNYDASQDANDMLRDLARGIKQYRMAGAL